MTSMVNASKKITGSPRILVTGASGFIGSHLVCEAIKHGCEVLSISRRADPSLRWSLGEHLPIAAQQGIDYAIHLAHDFEGEDGSRRTVEGTLAIIEGLRKKGVRRQVFFSSLSANPRATSIYGRTKFEIENRVAKFPDVTIIRPGLVLGDGGIYGRIRNWVRAWPVAPLPDGGRGEVYVIDVEKLCQQTLSILITGADGKELNLFEPVPKRLRDLVQQEARDAGKRVFVISIPSGILLSMLALAERIKLPLPVKADNLAGFLANQSAFH